MSDWEITLTDQIDSVDNLWRGDSFWQYELNSLMPNRLNEHDVALL